MTDRQTRSSRRERMYGEHGLMHVELFAGGYLNFGYWQGIRAGELSAEHRVASQEAMYRLVVGALEIADQDRVLEVGSGLGRGTALVAEEYPAREVSGVDQLASQVDRAKSMNAAAIAAMPGRLRYIEGSASDLPMLDRSVHKLFSVEAAQHFEDVPRFADESYRVLAPAGRLSIASFFSTGTDEADLLAQRLETFADGIDLAHPIDGVVESLGAAEFVDVAAISIGGEVWPGFDRWLARTSYAQAWPREWLGSYQDGLLDYYLITARKP